MHTNLREDNNINQSLLLILTSAVLRLLGFHDITLLLIYIITVALKTNRFIKLPSYFFGF